MQEDVKVLCATTTLCQGVNLPAHLCIVKSTSQYETGKGYQDYSNTLLQQMIGRGRSSTPAVLPLS